MLSYASQVTDAWKVGYIGLILPYTISCYRLLYPWSVGTTAVAQLGFFASAGSNAIAII